MPVVDLYRKQEGEKVLEVDSTQPVDKVYADIKTPIAKLLQGEMLSRVKRGLVDHLLFSPLSVASPAEVPAQKAAPEATAVHGQDVKKPTEAERQGETASSAPTKGQNQKLNGCCVVA